MIYFSFQTNATVYQKVHFLEYLVALFWISKHCAGQKRWPHCLSSDTNWLTSSQWLESLWHQTHARQLLPILIIVVIGKVLFRLTLLEKWDVTHLPGIFGILILQTFQKVILITMYWIPEIWRISHFYLN